MARRKNGSSSTPTLSQVGGSAMCVSNGSCTSIVSSSAAVEGQGTAECAVALLLTREGGREARVRGRGEGGSVEGGGGGGGGGGGREGRGGGGRGEEGEVGGGRPTLKAKPVLCKRCAITCVHALHINVCVLTALAHNCKL